MMPPSHPSTIQTDKELLGAYVNTEDAAAFEQLLNRHGPMVMGLCRRILRDPADADDAFQGTFLVLVERAAAVRSCESLAGWLYRIAYRIAVRVRITARLRMRKLEMLGRQLTAKCVNEGEAAILAELDAAIEALPDAERTAIVLCDLEGRRHKEVAQQLGVPISTISNRVDRGRARLRRRLQRQGVIISNASLSAALCGLACQQTASAAIVDLTLIAARQVRLTGLAGCSGQSVNAVSYAKSIVAAMRSAKLPALTIMACTAISVGMWHLGPSLTTPIPSNGEATEPVFPVRQVVHVDPGSPSWNSIMPLANLPGGKAVPPRDLSMRPFSDDGGSVR